MKALKWKDGDPIQFAVDVERLGAGEILLTDIDLDGTMEGYNKEITRQVADAVSIPIIASGGCGCYKDMAEVLHDGHASSIAAASVFHFTEQTPMEAKLFLRDTGFPTRA